MQLLVLAILIVVGLLAYQLRAKSLRGKDDTR